MTEAIKTPQPWTEPLMRITRGETGHLIEQLAWADKQLRENNDIAEALEFITGVRNSLIEAVDPHTHTVWVEETGEHAPLWRPEVVWPHHAAFEAEPAPEPARRYGWRERVAGLLPTARTNR